MSFKFRGKSAAECENKPVQAKSIPEEVLRGLSPEAVERLRGYVDASENFRRRVYGGEPEPGKR